eukprot:6128479-Amphidinium_carterae.2
MGTWSSPFQAVCCNLLSGHVAKFAFAHENLLLLRRMPCIQFGLRLIQAALSIIIPAKAGVRQTLPTR